MASCKGPIVAPLIRESRTVLVSGFHAVDSGFQLLDSSLCQWNLDSGFHSLVGFRIPCLSCIPDSKTQDSRFNKQTFPGFRNPDFLTWGAKYPAILNERKLVNNTLFLGVHYSTTSQTSQGGIYYFPIRQSPHSVV